MDKVFCKLLSRIRYKINKVSTRQYPIKRKHTARYFFLCITGFMGSGKTTFGKKLALIFNSLFLDTDSLIEENEQLSIVSIFEKKGEQYFRTQEYKLLQSIFANTHLYCTKHEKIINQHNNTIQQKIIIISLGGGTVQLKHTRNLFAQNNSKTLIILLSCPLPVIKQRLARTNDRPLFNTFKYTATLKRLYKKRLQLYAYCKHVTLYQTYTNKWSSS